ncbi:MAG: WD40 repeat domain-containing protein, partial [Planctomycetota bacterium]|nr:WD40 repeat domain-containing protein [Planctomycetota bacterium]
KDAERVQKEKATRALLDAKKNLAQIYVEKSRLSLNLDEWLANQAFLVKALSFDDQASTRLEILESEQHPFQWRGRYSTSTKKNAVATYAVHDKKQLLLFKNDFGTLKTLHMPSHSIQKSALSLPKDAGEAREFALAQDRPYFAYAPKNGMIKLWSTESKSMLWSKKAHTGPILKLRFSNDGERLVSLGTDKTIKFWQVDSGALLRESKAPRRGLLSTLKFSLNDRWAATFSQDNSRVLLFDGKTGAYLDELKGHKYGIAAIDFHPSEQWLVSAGTDKTLRIWDLKKQRSLKILRGHNLPLTDVKVSPNGQWIASTSRDKTARLWDFQSRLQIAVLSGHDSAVTAVEFSGDSQSLATGSALGKVRHWTAPRGKAIIALAGHKNAIRSLHFSKFGKSFHSFDGRSLQIWNLTGAISSQSLLLSKKDRFFTVHSQSNALIYGRDNLWTRENIETGKKQRYRAYTDRDLEAPAFHPKKDRALFATDRGEIAWISSSNVVLSRRKTAFDMIVTLRVNPDESVIIAGSQNRRPCVQFYKGQDLTPLGRVPEGLWQGIRWSGPSRAFARNLSKPKTLYEIDMVSGLTKPFITLTEPIEFFHFTSDYSAVVIQCLNSEQLIFYDLKTEKIEKTLELRVNNIARAAWSPNGERLVYIGSKNKEEILVLYDLRHKKELAVIPLRRFGSIFQLRFSPDSQQLKLLVSGRKLSFVVWELRRLETLFSASVKELTRDAEKRSGLRVEGFQLIQIKNKN